jgi:hypothetical protein
LVNLEFESFYEVRVVAKSGLFEATCNISVIDTGSKGWPKVTTTTTTTTVSTTEIDIEEDIEYQKTKISNEDYALRNYFKIKNLRNPQIKLRRKQKILPKLPGL